MTSSTPTRRRLALASALVAVGVLGSGAVAAVAATPPPSAERAERTPAEGSAGQEAEATAKAERKAERSAAKARRKPGRRAHTGPAFVCDPALSHGRNASAYARSLPESPRRGRLVAQAARSDCGRTPGDD